ncbi:N(G),N(G)-dimethylarginine dimethylaminohydrolase, partial [Desulfosarcina sp.]|nr:N(G),N(G)-dimethylarginine dimethylaminohydrolase [Desulfosarcina sp.]
YLENNNMLIAGEFESHPEFQKFNQLFIDPAEMYAANSLWINDKALVPDGNPKTKKMIEDAGYEVISLDMSEFRKLDGGLSCLSLRF